LIWYKSYRPIAIIEVNSVVSSVWQNRPHTTCSAEPLVSILINNYNYGHFLAKAIDSALSQTYANVEVIVVDDGSTDDSREILASYGDRIHPILQSNGGQASSFNAGFAACRGEIICLLDADDWFLPHKAERVVAALVQNPAAGWCFHPLTMLNTTTQTVQPQSYSGDSGNYDVSGWMQRRGKLAGLLPFDGTATSGLCFTRSLLCQILPMPEEKYISLSDDYLKYVAFGLAAGYAEIEELAVQRLHGNNAFTARSDQHKQQLRARIHVLTAYWMRHNYPALGRFANNLFAAGKHFYRSVEVRDGEDDRVIAQYWDKTPWFDRLYIQAKRLYYRYKP
jgi:glycosyltransferase involved in cell wall biosynthesis